MKTGLALASQGGDDHCGRDDADSASTSASSQRHRPARLVLAEIKGPCQRTSADFARQATIAEFGWLHARALDQTDFCDRPSGQFLAPGPEEKPL